MEGERKLTLWNAKVGYFQPLTNEFCWFVLSSVDDALKSFSDHVQEFLIALKCLSDDEVYLGLKLEKIVHHRSLSLTVTHYGRPRFLKK